MPASTGETAMTTPQRVEHQQTDKGNVPVYATGVVEQPWEYYSETDHAVWRTLFRRQQSQLRHQACQEFLEATGVMGMSDAGIPKFSELNRILEKTTGWRIIGVEGLLPELDFFEHLANRRFPVTWWIRRPDQLDYLSEPDLFHDLYGHAPLLMSPLFADYMQAYGRGGLRAHGFGPQALAQLTRLYWYTVEFGLIDTAEGLRIYGAGILSSKGECDYCLNSAAPNRIGFDLQRVMNTRYRIDTYQKTYFVIDSFQQLFEATLADFAPVYGQLEAQAAVPAGAVLDTDRIFSRGNGEGWLPDGDV
jgi:phenylalanine-4-hydroxylase